jgi:hypothetical protein
MSPIAVIITDDFRGDYDSKVKIRHFKVLAGFRSLRPRVTDRVSPCKLGIGFLSTQSGLYGFDQFTGFVVRFRNIWFGVFGWKWRPVRCAGIGLGSLFKNIHRKCKIKSQ